VIDLSVLDLLTRRHLMIFQHPLLACQLESTWCPKSSQDYTTDFYPLVQRCGLSRLSI